MRKRQPNLGLGKLITESGWTHSQFATAVNRVGAQTGLRLRYDGSAVSHWLGGTMPRRAVRPFVVEALARRLGRPVTGMEAGFPAPSGSDQKRCANILDGLIELGRLDMDPSRRGVLGTGLFSVALTIPDWPDAEGRMEAARTGRTRRIGQADVDVVVEMTEKVSELDDQFGGRHARPMAASLLVNTVAPYLHADAPQEVRNPMLSAASDLCYLTGYMAVDEGLHGLAQRYYVKALELARAAEDHLTYCTTLRGMSLQAIDLGHHGHALRLADAAAAASPAAGPRMRAFLAGQQAHAHAATGDRGNALRFIREAEVAMEKAEAKAKAFGSYDPAALTYHTAQVRYSLGDKKGALRSMEASARLCYSHYRRTRVRRGALLAERQLELGHLEAACATWDRVLDDYPLVQSGRADQRVAEMRRLLAPHSRNTAAKDVLNRAAAGSTRRTV